MDLMNCPSYKIELRAMEKEVARRVKTDVQAFYDTLIQDLQDAGELSNSKLVFKLLHRLGRTKGAQPPGPRPLPMLQKQDGTFAATFQEQQTTWLQQFSAIEAGHTLPWSELQTANADLPLAVEPDLDPAMFAAPWQIQRLLSKLHRDKVPGPNQIPPAVFKIGGSPLSKHLSVLFTKVAAMGREPLSWKGGLLVPLWKGKESPTHPGAYRSIFISDYSAKLFHQCIRHHLIHAWESSVHTMQYGGRAGLGADLAHHVVQSHQHWCRERKRPNGVLFVDLKSAFYTVIRQAFLGHASHDDALLASLVALGLQPDDVRAMLATARADNVTAGLTKHAQSILDDLLRNTHFVLPGLPEPCRTQRGTRPGDPIADVLFNFVMSKVLEAFHLQLGNGEVAQWLGHGRPVPHFQAPAPMPSEGYLDVTFVDDCAIMIHAATNDKFATIVQQVVPAFTQAAFARGLEVNFSSGKTELLWNVYGRGAKAWKLRLHLDQQCLRWQDADQSAWSIRVCHEYKHLGTWVQSKHRHAREVSARIASAKQQFGRLARAFFTKRISLSVRTKVFQSIVLSKLCYNAHVWVGATSHDLASLETQLKPAVGVMLKGKLADNTKFQHTAHDMFALCSLLPVPDQIHAARLRYFARWIRSCPQALWSMTYHATGQDSWTALLRMSFHWLCTHCPSTVPVQASDPLHDWIQFVSLDQTWKARIRKTCKSALAYHHAKSTQVLWEHHFSLTLAAHGAVVPMPDTSSQSGDLWQCDLCEKRFSSSRALAMHAVREHNYKKKARYYTAGATCPACLKHFHHRTRLAVHLEQQESCFQSIQSCWPPMPHDEVEALDATDRQVEADLRAKGWWATKAFLPAVQTQGAAIPPHGHPDCAIMHARTVDRRPSDRRDYENLQGRRITQPATASTQFWWQTCDLPPFVFQSSQGVDPGHGCFQMQGLAREAAILHVRALVAIHFFSGYRRTGDIHEVVNHHVQASGTHIFFISVDLCMQRQSADLASDASMQWWLNRASSGQIVSLGGGPPCETYTAARYNILDTQRGPRPLRSASDLSGLPGLSRRERAQIWIGDHLIRFLLRMLLAMAAQGLSGFLEHPQFPTWCADKNPPSIWSWKTVRMLKGLQCCSIVSFDQCVVGASSRKPTTLLLIRLPNIRNRLLLSGHFGRCCHGPKAHEGLIGKQSNGAFQTARAKVYPPGLNNIIGHEMFLFAKQFDSTTVARTLPEDFDVFESQQLYAEASMVQPDYHG